MSQDTGPPPQPASSPGGQTPTGKGGPTDYSTMPKAGFLYRFIAWLIDAIILGIIQGAITAALGTPVMTGVSFDPVQMASRYSAISAISLIIGVAYFVYFWGDKGATPGKMALGLKVIGTDGSMPVGYPKAFVRYIGYIISSIICMLGYLLIIIDDDNQGLHDKIASTYVVKTP